MIRNEPIIAVKDIAKSREWYQGIFGCKSLHGGDAFEVLADEDNTVILCLHKWGDHHHPTLSNPQILPGNGLILYFRVSELTRIWKNVNRLKACIEEPPHLNENSGKEEFSVRDLDGYYLTISL